MIHEIVALGDVCEFLDSKRVPITESDRKPGPYPYYGANGQQDFIDDYIFDEPLVLLAEDGGYFGSTDRPIAYKVTGKCWVNNHAHVLRPKSNIDIDYLHRVLSYYDVTKYVNGTTRQKLTKGNAENISFPLPPLPEQRRIAELLSRADRLRQVRTFNDSLSASLLQSVFLGMFGDIESNSKGWEKVAIDDALALSQYGTSNKSNPDKLGYPVLGMSNITYDGRLELGSLSYVEISDSEFQELRLKKGDIIFNRTNSTELVGKTTYWNHDFDAVLASYLVKLKLKENVLPEYFVASLNMPYYKNLFQERCKKAVGQSNISPTLIREFPILIPPLPEQKEFAAVVQRVESLRARAGESARQGEELFQSLLSRSFGG